LKGLLVITSNFVKVVDTEVQTKARFPTEDLLEYDFFSLMCLSFFSLLKKFLDIRLEERISNNRCHGSCLLKVSFIQGARRLNRIFFLVLEILSYLLMVSEQSCLVCVFTSFSTDLSSKGVEEMARAALVHLYAGNF